MLYLCIVIIIITNKNDNKISNLISFNICEIYKKNDII